MVTTTQLLPVVRLVPKVEIIPYQDSIFLHVDGVEAGEELVLDDPNLALDLSLVVNTLIRWHNQYPYFCIVDAVDLIIDFLVIIPNCCQRRREHPRELESNQEHPHHCR